MDLGLFSVIWVLGLPSCSILSLLIKDLLVRYHTDSGDIYSKCVMIHIRICLHHWRCNVDWIGYSPDSAAYILSTSDHSWTYMTNLKIQRYDNSFCCFYFLYFIFLILI